MALGGGQGSSGILLATTFPACPHHLVICSFIWPQTPAVWIDMSLQGWPMPGPKGPGCSLHPKLTMASVWSRLSL